jgi:hypothetical protein
MVLWKCWIVENVGVALVATHFLGIVEMQYR